MPLNFAKLGELSKLLNQPLPGGRGFQQQYHRDIERLCREAVECEPTEPAIDDPLFTEEDRETVYEVTVEETRDSVKDIARETVRSMTKEEVVGYLVNTELLLPYHKLTNASGGENVKELLADIAAEPPEDYVDLVRLGLLVMDGDAPGGFRITDFGIDVLQEWY